MTVFVSTLVSCLLLAFQSLLVHSRQSSGKGDSFSSKGLQSDVYVSSTPSDVEISSTRSQTFNSSIPSHTDISPVTTFVDDNLNCPMVEGGFWNRKTQKPKDYLDKWCPQTCEGEHKTTSTASAADVYVHTKVSETEAICTRMDCFPCHCIGVCDFSSARCCSKAFRPSLKVVTYMGCLLNNFLVVMKCPQHQTEEERRVREGCESDVESYIMAKPVTDMKTGRTFRNMNCATCHNATSLAVWTRRVDCEDFQHVYTATSEDEMISLTTVSDSSCTVSYLPPDNVSLLKCEQAADFFSGVIKTCNVTGRWETYDEEIEKHCLDIDDLFYRVKDSAGEVYRNFFCAICNGHHPQLTWFSSPGGADESGAGEPGAGELGVPELLPPLTLLLGLVSRPTQHKKQEISKCLSGQGRELNGVCRNLTCTPGKLLTENNTCSTALADIRGLMYKLNITLVPNTDLALNTSWKESLKELVLQLGQQLENKTQNYTFEHSVTITLELFFSNYSDQVKVVKIMLTGDITASREMKRDIAEGFLVKNLFFDNWVLQRLDLNKEIALIQHIDLESLQNTTTSTNDENVTVYRTDYSTWAKDALKSLHDVGKRRIRLLYALVKSPPSRNDFSDVREFLTIKKNISETLKIKMNPLLLCAYIQLSRDEFMIREREDGQKRLVVVSEHYEAELDSLLYVRLEENEVLNVCIETFEALKYVLKTRPAPLWQHVLSWIAIPMSVLCVFLTFVVYALLPALRTQPGLNVMGTCAALFVAQVALLLASNLRISGVWCQALGILVHEAWLSVFCWMVVCSMHMFFMFSAKTRHESRSLIWKTARNIAVSITLPAVVVALVVAVSYVQSKGESIGYSSESCFLSSHVLVGTAMVLPLSVIVVLNLALFLLTVRRIHEVTKLKPHLDSKQESHQHVWVCARLSMLTGVMWTLSLLSEGLDLDWLRGLSILANGGQGVLLFLSYVSTRRVRMLLCARLGHYSDVTSTTGSTTDKLSSTVVSTIHSSENEP